MLRAKKRGQGEVVTSVLLVLLVLAAIAIVAPLLLNFLQKGVKGVTASCMQLDLQPLSCVVAGDSNATVSYKFAGGDVNLTGVKLILEKDDGSTKVIDGELTKKLETRTMLVDFGGTPSKFTVAGVVITENGDEKTCKANPNKVDCS